MQRCFAGAARALKSRGWAASRVSRQGPGSAELRPHGVFPREADGFPGAGCHTVVAYPRGRCRLAPLDPPSRCYEPEMVAKWWRGDEHPHGREPRMLSEPGCHICSRRLGGGRAAKEEDVGHAAGVNPTRDSSRASSAALVRCSRPTSTAQP